MDQWDVLMVEIDQESGLGVMYGTLNILLRYQGVEKFFVEDWEPLLGTCM